MQSLTDVTQPKRHTDNVYELDVVDGWRQGRGAFGGYTIAALIRAIEHRVADPSRKVRSVTAELPAPVEAGRAEIPVEVMRTGNRLSAARASLVQANETRAHVVAVLAASRPGSGPLAWRHIDPPRPPPWRSLAPFEMRPDLPFPEFAHNFEYRVAEGAISGASPPSSHADSPARTVGWVRPKVPCALHDTGYVASCIDAWWPAAFTKFSSSRPSATITFTLELVTNLDGLDPEAPLLYRGTVPVCCDGYFYETRELWGEDGRLVALNHQTFAVI